MLAQTVEKSQLPDNTEHEFASRRHLRMRDAEHSIYLGTGMMVYEHLLGRRRTQRSSHLVGARWSVEVETDDEVGYLQDGINVVLALVVTYDFFGVGQPVQIVGKLVGNNHQRVLT